ncbi:MULTISPECIES: TMEM165/GDT1 family protein [Thioalkalivibrio]|uniref:GDT1 family protein n=1 Tax=Thioalkalivibrio halophilus TaxID=252474 RepID=A0A1V2ZXG9_9GAMM|nr:MULTISPECIES: TMEM165/GDT1 family protein [Thioalkalivibrio]OOC09701.1 UPF0016 family membrane protein [Thioalkalivibrio halophilus]
MELFLLSVLTVAVAEIGDRSMFLAALFGLRCHRLWPVFWGMTAGLFANQLVSAVAGVWLFSVIDTEWHLWLVAIAFLAMAVWVLIPEDDGDGVPENPCARSLFFTAATTFFLFEMADKTQLAVVALAGASGSLVPVVLGATLGILLITVPGLLLGRRFAERMPVHTLRWFAAALFLLIGLWSLLEALGWMPDLGLPDFSGALLEAAGRSAE